MKSERPLPFHRTLQKLPENAGKWFGNYFGNYLPKRETLLCIFLKLVLL